MKKLYHTIFDPVLKCSVAPIQMSEPSQFLMMRSRAELGGGGGGRGRNPLFSQGFVHLPTQRVPLCTILRNPYLVTDLENISKSAFGANIY